MKTTSNIEHIPDPNPGPAELVARRDDPPRPFDKCAALCRALASLSKTEAWCALLCIAHPEESSERVARYAHVPAATVRQAIVRLKAAIREDAAREAGDIRADCIIIGNRSVRLGDDAPLSQGEASAPPGVGSLNKNQKPPCARRGAKGRLTNAGKKAKNIGNERERC